MIQYGEIIKIGITIGILLIGFLLMRVLSRILIKIRRITGKNASIKKKPFTTIFEKIFFVIVLTIALFFLGFTSTADFTYKFIQILPTLFLFLLLTILGVLIVNIISWFLEKIIAYSRLEELVIDDISRNLVPLILISVKIILYIILIDFVINIVNIPGLNRLSSFFLYPVIILIFLMIFFVLINPLRDFAASFYLKNLWAFKPGNKIRFNENSYTIMRINWLSTELETKKEDSLVVPNRVLAAKGIEFKKPSKDIQTLEDIKNRFVAQMPSMCGPASAQIALSIFKINSEQKELAKLAESIKRTSEDQAAGTHPKKLIKAVEQFTKKQVVGIWIGFDKIYNLKQEISTWFNEGALIIIDYKKKYLFPAALRAHYSLVVGIKKDEILIIDPSGKKGGVYFADYRDVEIGMNTYSDLIKGKRGYIVLAPSGSSAYERIKEGLIYHHPSMYNKISKTLEMKLNKITSTPALLDMLPSFLRKHLKSVEKEQISRVWEP